LAFSQLFGVWIPVFAGMVFLLVALSTTAVPAAEYARVDGSTFASVLPVSTDGNMATVSPFHMQRTPVTNAEFLRFVRNKPEWRRGRVPELFADDGYLRHWAGPLDLGKADPQQPVVHVSWFAATAYCEAKSARLPTWHQWEWAAAADEKRTDARDDPVWRQHILNWYSTTGGKPLMRVGQGKSDVHGIHDLHGLIWEWVEDFGAMMVSGDNREQGDPDIMKFCGTGSLSMEQKEQYAVLMRIAMLSSLQASYTTANLGFRCVRENGESP
jgi:formylglycine-generating enzyme